MFNRPPSPQIKVGFAWLGLEDLEIEGKFVWPSGSPPVYNNFYVGQPNDGGHNEDCVSIHSSGKWFDDHCHLSLHPVFCQKRRVFLVG
ncbi:hypothetical protein ACOMHN_010290 [Nucella lapillus]